MFCSCSVRAPRESLLTRSKLDLENLDCFAVVPSEHRERVLLTRSKLDLENLDCFAVVPSEHRERVY